MRLDQPPRRGLGQAARHAGTDGLAEADGQASTLDDLAAVVLVADCLPVALIGQGGVAMLHAGWRWLAAGVKLEEGVRALAEIG